MTSNELHHSGRKGMKWGLHVFGRRQTKGAVRGKHGTITKQQKVKIPKKNRHSVDERLREAQFLDMYKTRDNMSTKVLKSKIARLEAEQRFKQLVEAPEKARREAIKKKKQARLAFIGKVGSAALDVYSKAPSSIAGRNLSGQAAKDAINAFKKRQEWAKAFKDVPTTMTKFTQSINVGGVDVYVPETIYKKYKRSMTKTNLKDNLTQSGVNMGENINGIYIPSQDELLLHYGKRGMKWKKKIKNATNSVISGIEDAANWVDDKTFDKKREAGLKDRYDDNERRINDPKYGKSYNTASDPIDGKKNVDVKRAIRDDKNVTPARTHEGMRQENRFIKEFRKRIKLPRVK